MMSKYAILPYKKTSDMNVFDVWERAFLSPFSSSFASAFPTDVLDKGDRYLLEAELPGFERKDIDITIEGDQLVIKASHETKSEEESKGYLHRERRFGSFIRRFDINGIDVETIQAAYENGLLQLTLPKLEEKKVSNKKIVIQ